MNPLEGSLLQFRSISAYFVLCRWPKILLQFILQSKPSQLHGGGIVWFEKQSGYSYSPVNRHRQAIFTALSLIFEAGLIPLRVAIFIFVLKILKDFCFYHCFNSPSRVRFKVMVVSGISNSSLAKSVYEPVNIALKKIHVGLRTSILAELP